MNVGGHGDPPFDYGCGDHSERRSARRGSSQSITINIFLWRRRKSRRQPHHKETWVQLVARASELRAHSKRGSELAHGGDHPAPPRQGTSAPLSYRD
eukprot:1922251-Pleurochrysis_carterae.AAC.1